MTTENTTKLSELIEREATVEQYLEYGRKVAEWTKGAYDNYAFKLYRPDESLDGEDKYMYSMEVKLVKNGHDEEWEYLEKLFVMNNMDAEKASIATAIALDEVMDDTGIAILSHSVTRGSLTNLTGTGPFPITGVGPVDARIYFTRPSDIDTVKQEAKENDTEIFYANEVEL